MRPSRSAPARFRPVLESLEDRLMPSAVTAVYVESNNPEAGQNGVLAFRRNPADGSLHEIGKFATGGTGQANPTGALGPDDSDQEVQATPDGRFLYAVNQGSDSVTAFRIDPDGRLDRVGTFASGGVQPDSIGIDGDRLFVSNRGDSATGHPGTIAPNVTAFTIGHDGSLTAIPGSTISFPVDTSPSQALVSRTGRFLFTDIFAIPGSTAAQGNTIAPFVVQPNGTLQLAPGGNVGTPASPPLLLGLANHPRLNIVYAGLTGASEIGVFTYNETGRLSFVGAVPDQGAAPCWVVVSADGQFLYTATTGTDSIGVFSLADPLHPVQIQEFTLGGPQAPPGTPAGQRQTADFQIALDPSGHTLYVVNQTQNLTGSFPQGNQLHVLSVGSNGKVSEPHGPIIFSTEDVPADARPQGVAVVRLGSVAGGAAANPERLADAVFAASAGSLDGTLDLLIQDSLLLQGRAAK